MARARFLIPLLFAVGLCLRPAPAAAQLQPYFDQASFQAVAGNSLSTADFESLPDQAQFPVVTAAGATFSSPGLTPTPLTAVGPASVPGLPSAALMANDFSFLEPSPVVIDFAPGVQAAALDLYSLLPFDMISPPGTFLTVVVTGTDGSDLQLVPLVPGGSTFFGVVASVGTITNITVLNPPGQARYVAVDNVAFGNLPIVDPPDPPADPLDEVLDALEASIAAGRADGSIRKLGTSLEDKLALVRLALVDEDEEAAYDALKSLGKQVLAQRGRHISRARADEILALVVEGLNLLDPDHPACQGRRRGRGHGHGRGHDHHDD